MWRCACELHICVHVTKTMYRIRMNTVRSLNCGLTFFDLKEKAKKLIYTLSKKQNQDVSTTPRGVRLDEDDDEDEEDAEFFGAPK